ncbi:MULTISPECIES: gluconokinase [unclassified Leucobacter]|uniref:gluconokinase n=1 Tax=unclassified Leucobacter TaxID=2621730 RepID=UPI001F1426BE|nr:MULTISPECIES: gluconokinase [unclassified Leucobacter]
MAQVPVVIMGVSGAGKSTVGEALAALLGRPFIDADHLHPAENRRKMEAETPLNDADREPWLRIVGLAIAAGSRDGSAPVVACSALKLSYRTLLRAYSPELAFVHLDGDSRVISSRLAERSHDYMPASLLNSQLNTLESPAGEPGVACLEIDRPVEEIAAAAADWLRTLEAAHEHLEETR